MQFSELSASEQRQLIDARQVYEAWRTADRDRRRRFVGSMRWARRKSAEYLLRKVGKHEKSLGLRSPDTEQIFAAFESGRTQNADRLQGLSARLNEMAPINRAMGLGRIPKIAARIIRAYDDHDLLGKKLLIVGTNAMFSYEAAAGVRIDSELLATGDVDLLLDARRQLTFAAIDQEVSEKGLLGLLRRVDTSFVTRGKGDYSASNRDGYFVDLICPQPRDPMRQTANRISEAPDDLIASEIKGLAWLENAPRHSSMAIDDQGFPVWLVTVDPRVFALHKAWLARQQDRDPLKRRRDDLQARVIAELAQRRLNLSFDDKALDLLPASVRRLAGEMNSAAGDENAPSLRPGW